MNPATHARDRPLISNFKTLPRLRDRPVVGHPTIRRRADVIVQPISIRARCSESNSRFNTLNMLVGSPRTRSARRRGGLSLASCHSGAVTFSVAAEFPTKAVSCFICQQKGLLLSLFSADKFTAQKRGNALTTYEYIPLKS
jgi:hypothetical protein